MPDDATVAEGDAGFLGMASRLNPVQLPPGMCQLVENMRHASVEAHVLDELAHSGGELHRVETRGHAYKSGISFYYGRVVGHQ